MYFLAFHCAYPEYFADTSHTKEGCFLKTVSRNRDGPKRRYCTGHNGLGHCSEVFVQATIGEVFRLYTDFRLRVNVGVIKIHLAGTIGERVQELFRTFGEGGR